ncbi:hypothetical protein BGZ59_000524 [Podila verticillata]|nr:hypothetical protein BGZ59_000524 [Podila verticillata]
MMTHDPDEMVRVPLMRSATNGPPAIDDEAMEAIVQDEEAETIHTFKLSSSGALLMCTMCDGRVSLLEFGEPSQGPKKVHRISSRQGLSGQHQCGYSTWIWSKDNQGQQQLILV